MEQNKTGWVSPEYTVSRTVTLNWKKMAANRCVAADPQSQEIECYRVLRTRILHRTKRKSGNTVMITSAIPGEGKTLTAINLALTFAKAFSQTVLLVDADLRMQNVHKTMGYESPKGLVEHLLDGCPISELMVWPGVDKLTVISGGKTIEESSELLGSPGMATLVEAMKNRYPDRNVLFDVAPVLAGADAISLAPLVDHIVFVVEAGRTSARDVERALDLLPKEKILGMVLNRHKPTKKESSYYTAYYSKYYHKK
jgi:non-specific protein-tyrosine kinase